MLELLVICLFGLLERKKALKFYLGLREPKLELGWGRRAKARGGGIPKVLHQYSIEYPPTHRS